MNVFISIPLWFSVPELSWRKSLIVSEAGVVDVLNFSSSSKSIWYPSITFELGSDLFSVEISNFTPVKLFLFFEKPRVFLAREEIDLNYINFKLGLALYKEFLCTY